MSFRRVGWLALVALATLFEMGCGEVYRPVVIPTSTTPPNPSSFHAVFAVSNNAASNPGSALQIDVAGDTNIGAANMGFNPTHIAATSNNARVFVPSAGSAQNPPQIDEVVSFSPASDNSVVVGLGNPIVYSLPPGSAPVFANSTQSSAMYVADYGTNSVSWLNTATNLVVQTSPVGSQPVAIAETPNGQNIYVVNQGDSTVTDLSPIDLSPLATLAVGTTPVWAITRPDSQRVYVVTQGDGKLYTINTGTNTVDGGVPVGAGANFALYDKSRNRIYVTNPAAATLTIFDGTSDPPAQLTSISFGAGSAACPTGCTPVSVTALPDASRFYVASYQIQNSCLDSTLGPTLQCIVPMLTVFDAASFSVKTGLTTLLPTPSPSLSLLTPVQFASHQYAVPVVSGCATQTPFTPSTTRFRVFTSASADSSHVYVSICDAGTISDVVTTSAANSTNGKNADTLITNIAPTAAACSGNSCGKIAKITAFQITSNVVTFTATNTFLAGQQVTISNLQTTAGAQLDGLTLTILSTGLSGSQFEAALSGTVADVPLTADTGTALALSVANVTGFSVTSNVATFQAVNTFTPGEQVVISNLTSSSGAAFNGLNLIVIAVDPAGTWFQAEVSSPDVALTPDSGFAVPLPVPQSPIFLLTGQ